MQSKERLVAMGFAPDILTDRGSLTPEQKLAGDMLLFSTGLMMLASVLWLAIYWQNVFNDDPAGLSGALDLHNRLLPADQETRCVLHYAVVLVFVYAVCIAMVDWKLC
jgi:hypothetical protein